MDPNSTLPFYAYAANMGAQYLDGLMTTDGLAAGLKEGNPVTRYMISKIGNSWTQFFKMGLVPFLFILIPGVVNHRDYATYLNFTMAAATVPVVIKNFFVLRKAKVSIF